MSFPEMIKGRIVAGNFKLHCMAPLNSRIIEDCSHTIK
jgi:hypothetical protein